MRSSTSVQTAAQLLIIQHAYLDGKELNNFRTRLCDAHRKGNCEDAEHCPHSHCQTWQRRSPTDYIYSAKLCPEIEFIKKGNSMKLIRRCSRGRRCMFAHSKEEELYHPYMYKTKFCNSYPHCNRYFCPFAHSKRELRTPIASTLSVPTSLATKSTINVSASEPGSEILSISSLLCNKSFHCPGSPYTIASNSTVSSPALSFLYQSSTTAKTPVDLVCSYPSPSILLDRHNSTCSAASGDFTGLEFGFSASHSSQNKPDMYEFHIRQKKPEITTTTTDQRTYGTPSALHKEPESSFSIEQALSYDDIFLNALRSEIIASKEKSKLEMYRYSNTSDFGSTSFLTNRSWEPSDLPSQTEKSRMRSDVSLPWGLSRISLEDDSLSESTDVSATFTSLQTPRCETLNISCREASNHSLCNCEGRFEKRHVDRRLSYEYSNILDPIPTITTDPNSQELDVPKFNQLPRAATNSLLLLTALGSIDAEQVEATNDINENLYRDDQGYRMNIQDGDETFLLADVLKSIESTDQ